MHPFRQAVEAKDLDAAIALFADDATLDSPVSFKPFEGLDAIRFVLGSVAEVFEDFRYTDEAEGDGVHLLVFRARVGEREVEGIDLLRTGEDGRLANITVLVRPLSGLTALAEAMRAKLAQ
jgi:SnoaL-like domain